MDKLKGRKAREFSVEFKEAAVGRLLAGESATPTPPYTGTLRISLPDGKRQILCLQVAPLGDR
jgi:hypothetical protein